MRAQMMIDDGQPRLLLETASGAFASWNATVKQSPVSFRSKLVEAGDTILVEMPDGTKEFSVLEADGSDLRIRSA